MGRLIRHAGWRFAFSGVHVAASDDRAGLPDSVWGRVSTALLARWHSAWGTAGLDQSAYIQTQNIAWHLRASNGLNRRTGHAGYMAMIHGKAAADLIVACS
jgi:hypothetical protein